MGERITPSFVPLEEARHKGAFMRFLLSETEHFARTPPIPLSPPTGASGGDIIPAVDGAGASASTRTPTVPADEDGKVAALQATLLSTKEALWNERTTVTELNRLLQQEAEKLALLQAESSVYGSASGSSMPRPRKTKDKIKAKDKAKVKNKSNVKSKSRVRAAKVPTSKAKTLDHLELLADIQAQLYLSGAIDGALPHGQGGRCSRVARASASAPPSNQSSSSSSSSRSTASENSRRSSEESSDPSTGPSSPLSSPTEHSDRDTSDSDYSPPRHFGRRHAHRDQDRREV